MPGDGKCMVCGAQVGKNRLGNCPDRGQEFCEQCGQCACLAQSATDAEFQRSRRRNVGTYNPKPPTQEDRDRVRAILKGEK